MTEPTETSTAAAIEALEVAAQALREAAAGFLLADDPMRAAICHSAHSRLGKEARELAAHLL